MGRPGERLFPKGVSGFALKYSMKLRKGNKRRRMMCRCWLGSPGMNRTKSPAPLTILCAFPTGFYSRDSFKFIFEVCGSYALNVLGISTLWSRVNGSSCKDTEHAGPGVACSDLSLVSLLKQVNCDRFKSETQSKAWRGRTCGGLKAE